MIYRFGACELDMTRRLLLRDGVPVHVEPQVLGLLHFLILNRARVLTKDEIIDDIWKGRAVSDAVLTSRMRSLRRAIDGEDAPSQVRTLHRVGYQFTAEVDEYGPAAAVPVAPPVAEPPSVAVLAFRNLSGDPDQDYFAEGMAEDITDMLARNRWLTVLPRTSAQGLDTASLDPGEAGRRLAVRYLLSGSVRRAGERIRISAQLADSADGRLLWSEKYDRDYRDVFELQDEISRHISATVEPQLSKAEGIRARAQPPDNLSAWEAYHRGILRMYRFREADLDRAEELFGQALALDPGFAAARARLAYLHVQKYWYAGHAERETHVRRAIEEAGAAIALDDRDALGRLALGRAYSLGGRVEDAIVELRAAIALNPGLAPAWCALGKALNLLGRHAEAIEPVEESLRLSPQDPHAWISHEALAVSYLGLDRLAEAEAAARACLRYPNASYWPLAILLSVLGLRGDGGAAAEVRERLRGLNSAYDLAYARTEFEAYRDQAVTARFLAGLERAGL